MDKNKESQDIDPNELPENVFERKEHFQYPQPADFGKAIRKDDDKKPLSPGKKQADKSIAAEGLNEARSVGDAGAFEGLENQGD